MSTAANLQPVSNYDGWEAALRRWLPNGIVFMTSLCFMGIEMAAGRLVSRHIGSSIYTWTTVIGVHFAGMSIGNYIGGRLAGRWRPSAILGELLILASFLCMSVLWMHRALGGVNDSSAWPTSRYSVSAGLEVTSNSLAQMRDEGLSEDVVKRVEAALRGRTYTSKDRLLEAVPVDLAAYKDQITAAAEPMGPVFQGMREDGVPDIALQALRQVPDRRFANLGDFEREVSKAIDSAPGMTEYTVSEIGEFNKSAIKHAREESVFQFAIRLIIMTSFIFLAPAMALGLISPVAAQMAIDAGRSSGRAVGNVYAWGAVGSIIGTFLTGFVLVSAMFVSSLIAATALTLAVVAVIVATPRLLQTIWLLLLLPMTVLVFHQRRNPVATDPLPEVEVINKRNQGESPFAELWHKFPESLGNTIRIRDEDLSSDTVESNYQFIKVSKRSHGDVGGAKDLLVLSLDHLIHGYVKLRMPPHLPAGTPWDDDKAEFDPSHLHYAYEEVYALAMARAVEHRFTDDPDRPGALLPPPMKGLFLGGGSYTFQRYMVETYPSKPYVFQADDTLRSILEREYKPAGKMPESEYADLEDRVRRWNRDTLGATKSDAILPGTKIMLPSLSDVAELDPMVTEVNHARLKLKRFGEEPRIKTWNYDARNFVESAFAAGWTGRYDVIFQDAFNHYSVPYHLTTQEFNDKISGLLTPDGVYICNVIDKYESARFMSASVVTMQKSFKHVYVLGDKRKSQRYGRETFVIVGANKDLRLEHLGGYTERVLKAVKDNDLAVLKTEMTSTGDQVGFDLIAERLKTEKPDDVYNDLIRLKKIDFRVLWQDYGADPADVKVRKTINFRDDEITDLIIEKGRPPSFGSSLRSMVLVRAFFGRTPAAFELTKEKSDKLRDGGAVPAAVVDKLQPILDKSFSTVEQLSDRLGELLTRAEVKAYKGRIVFRARNFDHEKSPPLVLTDSRAPVDDLLSPLFEED